MTRILAILPNAFMQKQLCAAFPGVDGERAIELRFVVDWEHAVVAAEAGRVHCLVFDPLAGGGASFAACRDFARRHPRVVLCAYSRLRSRSLREVLLLLVDAGVREVIAVGEDDTPAAIRARIGVLVAPPLAARVLSVLPPLTPRLERLVGWLCETASLTVGPTAAAQHYCSHPTTLRAHLRRAGLPTIERLIVWTRLLRAAYILEGDERTVESVAYELGYHSGASVGNQLKRYAGVSPSELRRLGGIDWLLEALKAQIARPAPLPTEAEIEIME